MKVSDVQTQVKTEIGDDSGVLVTDAHILMWINSAQLEITRKTQCSMKQTALAGVSTAIDNYTLPVDLLTLRRVTLNGIRLSAKNIEDIDNYSNQANITGFNHGALSGSYCLLGRQIYINALDAVSPSELLIDYVYAPIALTSTTDDLTLPITHQLPVVDYCVIEARKRLNENAEADRVRVDYERRVSEAHFDSLWGNADSYPAIRLLPGD